MMMIPGDEISLGAQIARVLLHNYADSISSRSQQQLLLLRQHISDEQQQQRN